MKHLEPEFFEIFDRFFPMIFIFFFVISKFANSLSDSKPHQIKRQIGCKFLILSFLLHALFGK